jgi:leucyl/phenylalanyl-tRNA--protein transferase
MFLLSDELKFPDPEKTNREGLLAIGGDLNSERLMLAYRQGIFPWFIDDGIIYWFSPPQRFVLFCSEIKTSRSMKRVLKSKKFSVTEDKEFDAVIRNCARVHKATKGNTWIDDDFISAYNKMYETRNAHSIEVWHHGELVGGMYGIAVGKIFCGESMFSIEKNASKVALIHLCNSREFEMIDCQIYSDHMKTMGARLIPRKEFLALVRKNSHK